MTGVISEFQNRSLFDIARMLPWKAGEWLVVMADPEKREPAMVELLDELTADDVPARRLRVGGDKNAWVNRMQDPPKDIVLLEGFDHWTPRDWQEADYLRSRLSRLGPQVWLLTPSGVRDMVNHAPNIASFVGGRVFGIGAVFHWALRRSRRRAAELGAVTADESKECKTSTREMDSIRSRTLRFGNRASTQEVKAKRASYNVPSSLPSCRPSCSHS